MIELKNKDLAMGQLVPVLNKFYQTRLSSTELALRISQWCKAVAEPHALAHNHRQAIINKYAMTHKSGKVKTNGNQISLKPGTEEDASRELEALMTQTVQVNLAKIPLHYFEDVGITPEELQVLEPILDLENTGEQPA